MYLKTKNFLLNSLNDCNNLKLFSINFGLGRSKITETDKCICTFFYIFSLFQFYL